MPQRLLRSMICLLVVLALYVSLGAASPVQASQVLPQQGTSGEPPEITPTPVDPLGSTPTPFVVPLPTQTPEDLGGITPEVLQPQAADLGFSLYFPQVNNGSIYTIFRSGQTFIVWPERTDLQGEQYQIYRSNQPITSENLLQATLLAKVGKNSANFYSNRYQDQNTSNWGPRYSDRLFIEDGSRPIDPNWGLLVWTLAPQDFGGATSGLGYYAVTVSPQGGPESYQLEYTIGPVQEAVATPTPVEITPLAANIGEGGHVYVQYMDLHNWNGTFHAPNPSNGYYGLDPKDPNLINNLQYAYDYAVFTPSASMCGGKLPDRLPVFLRLHGWKGNTSSAESGVP